MSLKDEIDEMYGRRDEAQTLAQVAADLNVHESTCWRWALKGIRGQKLATIKVGGRRRVRPEEVRRFLAALNAVDGQPEHGRPANAAQLEQVDDELKRLGL
jgi:hypothetical protein